MKLASVILVHDRPALTERTILSYLQTMRGRDTYLVVVDSGSGDETMEVLAALFVQKNLCHIDGAGRRVFFLGFDENIGPAGFNRGAAHALRVADEATHLHFSDNDVEYRPGWADTVADAFRNESGIGQLGLLEERFEQGCANVGNNCVIPRALWDAGLRWPEQRWHGEIVMSADVVQHGYRVARVQQECVRHLGWEWDAYPAYYEQVALAKGLNPAWVRTHFDRMKRL